jgi:hypothetical protein
LAGGAGQDANGHGGGAILTAYLFGTACAFAFAVAAVVAGRDELSGWMLIVLPLAWIILWPLYLLLGIKELLWK